MDVDVRVEEHGCIPRGRGEGLQDASGDSWEGSLGGLHRGYRARWERRSKRGLLGGCFQGIWICIGRIETWHHEPLRGKYEWNAEKEREVKARKIRSFSGAKLEKDMNRIQKEVVS